MWLVRLRMGPALPPGLRLEALEGGPSPTTASRTTSASAEIVVVLGVGNGALERLRDQRGGLARRKREQVQGGRYGQPWISRVTSRALKAEMRAYLYVDITFIFKIFSRGSHPRVHAQGVPHFYCRL